MPTVSPRSALRRPAQRGDAYAAALAIRLPSGECHQQPAAHLQQALLTLLQQAIGAQHSQRPLIGEGAPRP